MGKQSQRKKIRRSTRILSTEWVEMQERYKIKACSEMIAAAIIGGALVLTINGKEEMVKAATVLSCYLDGACSQRDVIKNRCKIGELAVVGMCSLGWAKKQKGDKKSSIIEWVRKNLLPPKEVKPS